MKYNCDLFARSSNYNDLLKVLQASKEFFDESGFSKLTFDGQRYHDFLVGFLKDPECDIITVWDKETLAGYAAIFFTREYTKERIGELYQFYVRKKYRKTGASRILAELIEQRFTDWDCAVSHSSADPRMADSPNNNSLFCNLWNKFGYKNTGILMTKERR